MTLENVVDMFGSSIGTHLVSRRVEMREGGPFKGIKTYRIEIWEVNPRQLISESEVTQPINTINKEFVVESVERMALGKMFDYYASK